jgi:ribosomal protein S18 acetylase RimI-like enzyme
LSTHDRDLVAQDKDLGVLGCLRSGQQSEPAQELAEDQVEESERHAGNDRGPPHPEAKAAGQRQGPGFRHRHAAQGLLVEHLFATTLANRLQAITNVENLAEQRALERIGFRREGVMRGLAFDGGRWHDGVLYARLRDDPT